MKNKQEEKDLKGFEMFRKVFGFMKPFVPLFIYAVAVNSMFSLFNTISIGLVQPIFQILFKEDSTTTQESNSLVEEYFYPFINKIISSENDFIGTLINFSMLIIGVFLVKNIFKYWGAIITVRLSEGIVKSIRDKIFKKLTSLSVDFFARSKEGEIISIVTNDVNVVNSSVLSSMNVVIREILQVVFIIFFLISISPYLTLIAFSTTIASFFILKFAMKYLRRYASRMQAAMADYTSALQESISGIRIIKAYNAENTAIKRFVDQTNYYVKSAIKNQKIVSLIPSVNEMFAIIALCVVLYEGGRLVLDTNELMGASLMQFLFLLFSVMSPVSQTFNNISNYQRGLVAGKRVFNILDQEPTVESGTEQIDAFNDSISINNIDFEYLENTRVISNASFKIDKGKKIAFVGSSGCGKSTMLDLIIRFYDPSKGSITIDGRDIRDLKCEDHRNLFGIVAQETVLFNDTIANNIRFGYDANEEEVIQACKVSNAWEFVEKMSDGLDTIVGDRGVMLSGGQRQRIAIARAMLRNPQILIFDEATSALDSESEKIVQTAINQTLENRTAILVAHRLATIIDSDEILVFDQGRIVENGSHQELIELDGVYKKLYDIQFASKSIEK
jgi:ABC-type multidrug transport system fused ATPase/permease subunit